MQRSFPEPAGSARTSRSLSMRQGKLRPVCCSIAAHHSDTETSPTPTQNVNALIQVDCQPLLPQSWQCCQPDARALCYTLLAVRALSLSLLPYQSLLQMIALIEQANNYYCHWDSCRLQIITLNGHSTCINCPCHHFTEPSTLNVRYNQRTPSCISKAAGGTVI